MFRAALQWIKTESTLPPGMRLLQRMRVCVRGGGGGDEAHSTVAPHDVAV